MTIKILNLYAGIGGNRKLWPNGEIEVTAIEIDPKIAKIYQDFFPQDKVIIADAHQFLLDHFKEFDFIWSSPPCPTHSRARKWGCGKNGDAQNKPIYPDMNLYQEILFLSGYCLVPFVVENVISWYSPLIRPFKSGRHYFWANFHINDLDIRSSRTHDGTIEEMENSKEFNLENQKGINKKLLLRNCVEPELGLHVFNCAFKIKQQSLLQLKPIINNDTKE